MRHYVRTSLWDMVNLAAPNGSGQGGAEDDVITASGKHLNLRGKGGNDTLTARGNFNRLRGDEGDDALTANGNRNALDGGNGNDTLTTSGDHNALRGGDGNDSLTALGNHNALDGGNGNDELTAIGDFNTLRGGDGNDVLTAIGSFNQLRASGGNDALTAIGDHNTLSGGTGNDELTASGDFNALSGGTDADRLVGGRGADTLMGGGGADVLYGGQGNDRLEVADAGFLRIDGGSGTDTLAFGGTNLDFTTLGSTKVEGIEGIDLTGHGAQAVKLNVTDVLKLSDTSNTLRIDGEDGDRLVLADRGGWTAGGDSNGDGFDEWTNGVATLNIRSTMAVATSSGSSSVVEGLSGNNTLVGSGGTDTLIGGAGSDTYLVGLGSGADRVDNTGQAADGDKILFGSGIATDQLWFQQTANDLKVSLIGTSDSVTVANWFASGSNHVATLQTADGHVLADSAVQNLVTAMATLTPPPAGQTTLTAQQHQQLDTVIAANWH